MNPTPSRLFHYDHSPFVTNPLIFITVYYHLLTTSSHCIKLKYIIYVPTLLKCPDMHFVYKNRIGLRSAVRLAVVSSLINIIFHTTNLFALMYPLDLPNLLLPCYTTHQDIPPFTRITSLVFPWTILWTQPRIPLSLATVKRLAQHPH